MLVDKPVNVFNILILDRSFDERRWPLELLKTELALERLQVTLYLLVIFLISLCPSNFPDLLDFTLKLALNLNCPFGEWQVLLVANHNNRHFCQMQVDIRKHIKQEVSSLLELFLRLTVQQNHHSPRSS